MNPRQQFALSNPLTRSHRWAIDSKYSFNADVGGLSTNVELAVFGSVDGETPSWFVCALLVDSDNALIPLSQLSDEGRDWIRQMASGLLEGVGSGDPKVMDSHAGVIIFKDLSTEEVEALPAEAKLGPRVAITKI